MGELEGKVLLVTGGARSIGREIALTFAREGADVVTCDVAAQIEGASYPLGSEDELQETVRLVEAEGVRCLARVADVRDQDALDALVADAVDRLGGIDVAIPSAGIIDWRAKPFWETPDFSWDDQIGVNLTGAWRTAKAVAPQMIERGSGSIAFIASNVGIEGAEMFSPYVAAKHGVLGLMKSAALELGRHGVRANAVCPGTTDTIMNDNELGRVRAAGKPDATTEEYRDAVRNWVILRDVGPLPPHAIADAMLWLASERARYVTGIELKVDGGHLVLPGFNHNPAMS